MVRIKCELSEAQSPENGVLVSAYKDPEKENLVYVFVNLSEEEMKVNMGNSEKASTYTTDENRNMGFSLQPLNRLTLPSRSVVTVLK